MQHLMPSPMENPVATEIRLEDALQHIRVRTQGGVLLHIYEELARHRGYLDITADLLAAGR